MRIIFIFFIILSQSSFASEFSEIFIKAKNVNVLEKKLSPEAKILINTFSNIFTESKKEIIFHKKISYSTLCPELSFLRTHFLNLSKKNITKLYFLKELKKWKVTNIIDYTVKSSFINEWNNNSKNKINIPINLHNDLLNACRGEKLLFMDMLKNNKELQSMAGNIIVTSVFSSLKYFELLNMHIENKNYKKALEIHNTVEKLINLNKEKYLLYALTWPAYDKTIKPYL
jgi:hypothetical protein